MARQQRWVLSAALLLASTLSGQTVPVDPSVFSELSGEWTGEGTLFDRAARFSMVWRHEDGFATLHFANAFVDAGGDVTPVIRSAAVYRIDDARPEGVWLDSRGVQIELSWEQFDSVLVVTWTAPTETGRTSYRLLPSGEIDVVDEVRSGDEWRTFATTVYRKKGTRSRHEGDALLLLRFEEVLGVNESAWSRGGAVRPSRGAAYKCDP